MSNNDHPLAFDTETINRPDHGEACQLIAESENGEIKYFDFPDTFLQIFKMLCGGRFIAFNASFDIRAITHPKFLPEKVLEQLAEYDCAIWKQYRFISIPNKWFKCWVPGIGGFEIFDIKSFFQGHSLASAAETFLNEEHKIDIAEAINRALKRTGKRAYTREYVYSNMDRWLRDPKTRRVATDYAVNDARILSKLYGVLAKSFEACGIPDPSLFSPGSAAMEIFGPILLKNQPPDTINTIFRRSYFGGRIEVAEMGNIPGPLYYYDIKSAYPYQASELPDLASACYHEGHGAKYKPRRDIKAGCYNVRVEIPDNWDFGPFPMRSAENKIYFPVGKIQTFIGKAGFDLIKEFKLKHELIYYHEFYGGNKKQPLNKLIREMYKLRKDPNKSLAIKLMLNSMYGKCAESDNHVKALPLELKGFAKRFDNKRLYGKYTNFVYAAAITEGTRLQLWRAAHKNGAVLLATDGIITRNKLKTGKELGEFDLKGELSRAYILGCGRYEIIYKKWQIGPKGERWKNEYHFRGFRNAAGIFDKLKSCSDNKMPQELLDTKSLKQWAVSKDKRDFNVLKQIKKDIIISDEKRFWQRNKIKSLKGWFKNRVISLPIKE